MGMFDYVSCKIPCAKCGHMITGWQSKDSYCELSTISPDNVDTFYSDCKNCGHWNEFTRESKPREKETHVFSLEEVLAMGFKRHEDLMMKKKENEK